jgi:hypothetical protein
MLTQAIAGALGILLRSRLCSVKKNIENIKFKKIEIRFNF